MPIRFRCSQCDRLLGIAKRKAGTRINCPQCGEETTVPAEDQPDPVDDRTLRELDNLLVPNNAGLLAPLEPAVNASPRPIQPELDFSVPAARPPVPRPAPKRPSNNNPDSLFEQDVDSLLGIGIGRPDEPVEPAAEPKAKPVNGMDAMSLEDGPGTIVLSSQKATLIVVVAVVLMLVAFVVGFAIRATI